MSRRRRGAIFVIALAAMVLLSAMLLVFSQEMRTEVVSSANRLSSAQADGVEQGAEQWVLAQLEANVTALPTSGSSGGGSSSSSSSSSSSTAVDPTTIPAEAIQIGSGYFWLLHPDPTQDQTYGFGITDESGKLNLNGATTTALQAIPGISSTLATSITTWPSSITPSASTSSSTSTTAAVTYESVDELLLVDQNLTPQDLYGYDLNHDGVIDANEQTAAGGAATSNGTTTDSRGMFNYLTVYSTNAQPGKTGTTTATPRAPRTIGLVNVNTAPAQVLMALGLTQSDATSLVSKRTSTPQTGTAWVAQTISPRSAATLTPYITGVSYQYSADIVAVSGDGRAFKRVRIVVDCRQQPARIIYRTDLTSLGWPLPPDVRVSMRAGNGVPADVTGTTNQQSGSGALP